MLDSLLKKELNDRIRDFISINVEGYEPAVVKNNNWGNQSPSATGTELNNNSYEICPYLDQRQDMPVLQNAGTTTFIKKFWFSEKNQ
jgi:hypothetical protein